MSEKTELQKVSEETMRFMRGKYVLDEVGDGKDMLEFCENGKIILTIRIHKDRYDFHIDDNCVPVVDLETLEAVKQMILVKKKPNRIPFSKEQLVISRCGMRCDLCVHYTGGTISEAFRMELKERIGRVYGSGEENSGSGEYGDMLCPGGTIKDCGDCPNLKCPKSNGLTACFECGEFPCGKSGGVTCGIEARNTSTDDITWAVLPYVDGQYGN